MALAQRLSLSAGKANLVTLQQNMPCLMQCNLYAVIRDLCT